MHTNSQCKGILKFAGTSGAPLFDADKCLNKQSAVLLYGPTLVSLVSKGFLSTWLFVAAGGTGVRVYTAARSSEEHWGNRQPPSRMTSAGGDSGTVSCWQPVLLVSCCCVRDTLV